LNRILFLDQAWEDYLFWQGHAKRQLKKINSLIEDCLRSPYSGIGKPEPLRNEFSGWWSRRIDDEHRLVYREIEGGIEITQCRYHYHRP